MKDNLEVGDIVIVHNPLRDPEKLQYPVTRIEGNKAITAFRTFNRKIYCKKYVYEYGKRFNPVYMNTYVVKGWDDETV